jgi:hypothetical protein
MSNNNNLLTEISMLILAVLLVLTGALLLYLGKISYDSAIFFFISALGLFGFNSAWKAPSPTQQQNTQQLLSQVVSQQAASPVPAQPVPAPLPAPRFTTPVPQPPVAPPGPQPQFMPVNSIPMQPGSTQPWIPSV